MIGYLPLYINPFAFLTEVLLQKEMMAGQGKERERLSLFWRI